jgi:hypothetical protein
MVSAKAPTEKRTSATPIPISLAIISALRV